MPDDQDISYLQALREVNQKINEHEKIAQDFEVMLSTFSADIDVPEGLQLFSPKNMYAMILLQIVGIKLERVSILEKIDSEERLRLQLAIAEENEDYDLCIKLKEQIENIKSKANNDIE